MNKSKLLALLLLMIATAHQVAAQKKPVQKIAMYKTFGGVVYELNDSVQLSTRQTMMLLYTNQPAYGEFKKARRMSTVSSLMGFTGAAMAAIPVATLAFGERSDWGLAGGGAALILGSIFVNRAFKARALYAIDLYNSQGEKTSRIKPEFFFYGTGAKLVIRF